MQEVGSTSFYINGYQTIRLHILQEIIFYNGQENTQKSLFFLILKSVKARQHPAIESFLNTSRLKLKVVCYNRTCLLLVGEGRFDSYNKST